MFNPHTKILIAARHQDQLSAQLVKAVTKKLCLLVTLLLQRGASPDVVDSRGFTPLCIASGGGDVEIRRVRCNARAALDHADSVIGWNALVRASSNGHMEVVWLLCSSRAVNQACWRGETALSSKNPAKHTGHFVVDWEFIYIYIYIYIYI